LPEARLEVAVALDDVVDDGLLEEGWPAGGVPGFALSLVGLLELDMLLEALLNFAFFSTKLPAALLGLALLDGLAVESVVDDAPARCRQPVALVESLAPAGDGCGGDVVGLCAASVPHSATAVLSVAAHCHLCVFFMTCLLRFACDHRRALGCPFGARISRAAACKARARHERSARR
jgi:hypothetical protein